MLCSVQGLFLACAYPRSVESAFLGIRWVIIGTVIRTGVLSKSECDTRDHQARYSKLGEMDGSPASTCCIIFYKTLLWVSISLYIKWGQLCSPGLFWKWNWYNEHEKKAHCLVHNWCFYKNSKLYILINSFVTPSRLNVWGYIFAPLWVFSRGPISTSSIFLLLFSPYSIKLGHQLHNPEIAASSLFSATLPLSANIHLGLTWVCFTRSRKKQLIRHIREWGRDGP